MTAVSTLEIPSLEGKVSPEEWAVRVDLAAAYRLVSLYGWEDLVFTHISARVPGTEDQFLINPYGVFFDEITASSLVKIDLNGDKVQDSPFPVNAAGFIIHSAVHSARHDAKCVLHTHTLNGVAVAAQRDGLLPLSQHSLFVITSVGYHDFEGPAIGRQSAEIIGREGGTVVAVDNDKDALESVVGAIRAGGGTAHGLPADALDAAQVEDVVRRTAEAHGRIDILVNAVGGSTII